MEEAPLLGEMSGPEDEMVPELFGAESRFVSESMALKAPAVLKAGQDEFPAFKDPYLGAADPKEPLLRALAPPLGADLESKVQAELLADAGEAAILAAFPGLPELDPLEDAALPAPPAYNVHLLSSLLAPHRGPAVVPLGAWALEGAAHAGVRVIPVEVKEGGGTIASENPEEAALQNPLSQESCKFPSSQEAEDTPGSSQKDPSPMVLCQLKGGTQMLCIDNSGTRELKALHLVPQYQDQNNSLQSGTKHFFKLAQQESVTYKCLAVLKCLVHDQGEIKWRSVRVVYKDAPKPMTALVGRFLPVPAKLNLITQLDNGAAPSVATGPAFPSGPALPGPPKITLAGVTLSSWDTKSKKPCNCTKSQCLQLYCDCFASGDFCTNCNCNNCCNNLRHGIERFKAIKACLDRNPEAFQPKIGAGRVGDVKPRHSKGCHCKRSGCLKNYCECYEAKIMCSSTCKCIGCKNYEESPERKPLVAAPSYLEAGGSEGGPHPSGPPKLRAERRSSCISWEVVEATCACLLAQGEEAEKGRCSEGLAEQMVLEEFGRCLSQILHIEFTSKGLKLE